MTVDELKEMLDIHNGEATIRIRGINDGRAVELHEINISESVQSRLVTGKNAEGGTENFIVLDFNSDKRSCAHIYTMYSGVQQNHICVNCREFVEPPKESS